MRTDLCVYVTKTLITDLTSKPQNASLTLKMQILIPAFVMRCVVYTWVSWAM